VVHDAVEEVLSGRAQLTFYGRMKGVPPEQLDQRVDWLLQRLGIEKADRDKPVKQYSGGMKRKLSLAFALIGQSDVLFLDEPSAAVDAGAKRLLWQAIKKRASQSLLSLQSKHLRPFRNVPQQQLRRMHQ